MFKFYQIFARLQLETMIRFILYRRAIWMLNCHSESVSLC